MKLHVFLGAGGVGKTTLSAGFALALACKGYKVGLMSIDPAKRLKSALGVDELSESGTAIALPSGQNGGSLQAAFLNVNESFKRWIEQEGMSAASREKLFDNKLFRAVVDKFATSTDTFAAVRVCEWAEAENFDHIVVDTAPGLNAVDFLNKPDRLLAFLDGKLVEWLKWFVGADKEKRTVFHRMVKSSAKLVLDGLAQIGGRNFLLHFGEFLVLLDDVFATMFKRLETTVSWLRSPAAAFYLVTAVREDAVYVARKLIQEMQLLGIQKKICIVNRAMPESLESDKGLQAAIQEQHSDAAQDKGASANSFLNYLASYAALQKTVVDEMTAAARGEAGASQGRLVRIPLASGLDGTEQIRLEDLIRLGNHIVGPG